VLAFQFLTMLSSSFILSLGLAASIVNAHTHDAKLGAAASESSVCTNIATDVLKDGGNAADAVSSIP
jgi:gamma-glutamyltranspeptidase